MDRNTKTLARKILSLVVAVAMTTSNVAPYAAEAVVESSTEAWTEQATEAVEKETAAVETQGGGTQAQTQAVEADAGKVETETGKESESATQTEPVVKEKRLTLPKIEGASYAWTDADKKDAETASSTDFIYEVGDKVEFGVESDLEFRIVDARNGEVVWPEGAFQDGKVSFTMPDKDLKLEFTAKETEDADAVAGTETQEDTESATAEEEAVEAMEAETGMETETETEIPLGLEDPELLLSDDGFVVDEESGAFSGTLTASLMADATKNPEKTEYEATVKFPSGTIVPEVSSDGATDDGIQAVEIVDGSLLAAMSDDDSMTVKFAADGDAMPEIVVNGEAFKVETTEPKFYPADSQGDADGETFLDTSTMELVTADELLDELEEKYDSDVADYALSTIVGASVTQAEADEYAPAGDSFTAEELEALPEGYDLKVRTAPSAVEEGSSIGISVKETAFSENEEVSIEVEEETTVSVRKLMADASKSAGITKITIWNNDHVHVVRFTPQKGMTTCGQIGEWVFTARITVNGKTIDRNLYCMQPNVPNPKGESETSISSKDFVNVDLNSDVGKLMYYGIDGPAWGKTANGINLKSVLASYGANRKEEVQVMTCYMGAYMSGYSQYDSTNFRNSAGNMVSHTKIWTKAGKRMLADIQSKIQALPDPEMFLKTTSGAKVADSATLAGAYDASGKYGYTEWMTYTSTVGADASVSLPANTYVQFLNSNGTATNLRGTPGSSVAIPNGSTFRVAKLANGTGSLSATFNSDDPEQSTVIRTNVSKHQKCAFTYYNGTTTKRLSASWEDKDVPTYVYVKKSVAAEDAAAASAAGLSLAGATFRLTSGSKSYTVGPTDASGNTAAVKVEPGTYTVEETAWPRGMTKAANGTVTVTDANTNGNPAVFSVAERVEQWPVQITKKCKTGYETYVNNNSNYSLAGAVFTLSGAGGTYTFTTDESGKTGVQNVKVGTYSVTETTAPKGYKKTENIQPVTVAAGQNGTVSFTVEDEPLLKEFSIGIEKATGTASTISLAEAKFRFDFYGGSGNLLTTWTMKTDQVGNVNFENPSYIVDGTPYKRGTKIVVPLGTVKVTETNPPKGLLVNASIPDVIVYQNASGAVETKNGEQLVGNDGIVVEEELVYGGVMVDKDSLEQGRVTDGDAKFENAEFTIYNDNDYAVVLSTAEDVAIAPGAVVTKIYTDANGVARSAERLIQAGTYHAVETAAPVGYEINDKRIDFEIVNDGDYIDKTGDADTVPEQVKRGGFSIDKRDLEIDTDAEKQGDAKLDSTFELYNRSDSSVVVGGKVYAKDAKIGFGNGTTFKTDAKTGHYETKADFLPYGTYEVVEVTPATGMLLEGENMTQKFEIREDGKIVNVGKPVKNQVKRGGVKLTKQDVEFGRDGAKQGDGRLDATFTIYNSSENDVLVDVDGDGKRDLKTERFAPGAAITTFKTDADDGTYASATDLLPYGTYRIVETKAATGYLNQGTGLDQTIEIREEGKIVEPAEPTRNDVIRGGFHLEKQDYELTYGKSTKGGNGTFQADHKFGDNGAQGDAKLSGAEFTLYNDSDYAVLVDVDGNGKRDEATELFAKGAVIPATPDSKVFVTDENGEIETIDSYLPYGSYRIVETKAPEGYTDRGANLEIDFKIRENGRIVNLKNDENSSVKDGKDASNEVVRFDVQLLKIDLMSSEDYNEADGWDDLKAAEGIEFEFYLLSSGSDAKPYCTITVGKDAIATTKSADYPHGRLPYGAYRVHEVIPESVRAKGYPYQPVKDFYVNGTKNNPTHPVKDGDLYSGSEAGLKADVPIEAFVKLIKLDLTSGKKVPLAGATFKVVDKDGNTVTQINHYPDTREYATWTTIGSDKGDNAGTVALPQRLKAGTYTIVELHAPKGYVLRSAAGLEEKSFTVDYRNKAETVLEWEIEDPDEMARFNLTKKDAVTGETINGAKFAVYAVEDVVTPDGTTRAKAGEKVDEFTVGDLDRDGKVDADANGVGQTKELYLGKYEVIETEAPEGYSLDATPIKFEPKYADENTPVVEVYETMENVPTEFELLKSDEERDGHDWTGKAAAALDGVTFEIERIGGPDKTRYDNGNAVEAATVVTADGGKIDVKYLASGTYSIKETKTLPGYVLDKTTRWFTVDADGRIAETDENGTKLEGQADGQSKLSIGWLDRYYVRYFSKVDMGGTEIPGAQMAVLDEKGDEAYSWTSTDEAHVIERIPLGKYVLREKVAAKGYVIATDVPFEVTEEGLVIDDVEMTDKKLIVSKVDVAGEEIPGAKLSVTDEDGNVMDEWTSTETPHDVENLTVGKSYALHEVVAAKGYAVAANVPFTVTDDGVDQKVTMTDKKVVVSKVDVAGEEIPGAKLNVTDKDGNVMDEWISTETPHEVDNLKVGETYVLHEVVAAKGFTVATDVEFTVTDDGADQKVVMTDKKVVVRKTDVMGEEVPGAELAVYELTEDADGNVAASEEAVDSWTSTETPHEVDNLVVGRKYRLVENAAPNGYAVSTSVDFTVTDDGADQTETMVDKRVLIDKTDATDGEEIEGAHLQVTDEDGNVVDEWVSGKEPHAVDNLKVGGTYVLTETLPADGYVTAESIEFVVNDDYKVDQKQEMKDERTKLEITKSDITDSKPVIGATLTIRNEEGEVVDEWVTEEKPHYVEKLPIGKYTLTETQLPGVNGMGYVTAETIEFEILDTPEIQKHEMKDDFTKVQISKVDIADSKPVIGATLQIKDAEGNVVDEWVTQENPHYVERLPIGKYTLTEIQLPGVNGMGYVTAETIEFEVTDTPEIQKHVMKDDFTKLEITKSDITDSKPVIGATLTIKDADGNVVDEWITEETPHYVERMPIGKYTLTETRPADGYVTAETVEFELLDNENIQTVDMKDDHTKVEITKSDVTDSKPVIGAELEIRDADGNVVDKWITEEKPHYVEKLPIGRYTLTETKPGDGYLTAETVEFGVLDTGEIQKVEMKDERTKLYVSKQDVTNGKELPGAKLEIRDEDGNVVEKWTSGKKPHYVEMLKVGKYTLTEVTAPDGYEVAETIHFEIKDELTKEIQTVVMKDAPKPKKTTTTPGTSTAPKTGDDFDGRPLAAAALAIAILAAVAFALRRRKEDEA